MSHVVTIQTQIRDATVVRAACRRLKLKDPEEGTFRLYSSSATGLGVQLEGWRYPVVCELPTGQLQFDNFGGRWGEQARMDAFLQAYAVERASAEARQKGFSVTEQALTDGSFKLTIAAGA